MGHYRRPSTFTLKPITIITAANKKVKMAINKSQVAEMAKGFCRKTKGWIRQGRHHNQRGAVRRTRWAKGYVHRSYRFVVTQLRSSYTTDQSITFVEIAKFTNSLVSSWELVKCARYTFIKHLLELLKPNKEIYKNSP